MTDQELPKSEQQQAQGDHDREEQRQSRRIGEGATIGDLTNQGADAKRDAECDRDPTALATLADGQVQGADGSLPHGKDLPAQPDGDHQENGDRGDLIRQRAGAQPHEARGFYRGDNGRHTDNGGQDL